MKLGNCKCGCCFRIFPFNSMGKIDSSMNDLNNNVSLCKMIAHYSRWSRSIWHMARVCGAKTLGVEASQTFGYSIKNHENDNVVPFQATTLTRKDAILGIASVVAYIYIACVAKLSCEARLILKLAPLLHWTQWTFGGVAKNGYSRKCSEKWLLPKESRKMVTP